MTSHTNGQQSDLLAKQPAEATAHLTASMEDYLEAIYHLSQANRVARVSQIAKRLAVNKSSVTGALRNLAQRKLINYDPYQYITLTGTGRKAAKDVVWRHRLLKRFLNQILGVDEEKAAQTACKLEHNMDRQVLDKLLRFLQFLQSSNKDQKSCLQMFESYCRQDQPQQPDDDSPDPVASDQDLQ